MLERLTKRIPAGQRFRPRIDVRVADAFVFRPGRNQPPTHELHRWLAFVIENYRRELCRRDVVARREKRHPRHDDADEFDQLAKIFRRRVSSAHDAKVSHAKDNACPTENLRFSRAGQGLTGIYNLAAEFL